MTTEKKAANKWKSSQKIAMEAAVMVQNPPHPKETWQTAKAKWEQAIGLLEAIPEDTFYAQQAKEKIVTYRTNYAAISTRIK